MGTKERKQRENAERDAQILEIARSMLRDGGYHALNMDRIAQRLEYAKGTIYNRFPNKEEIIIALAIQTMEKRTDMFERAAAFQGKSRERLAAIALAAELFIQRFTNHFRLEQVIRSDSIWEKTSEKRRNLMRSCELRCIGIVAGIVRDAVAAGDLRLAESAGPEHLVFGLWSLHYGAFSIVSADDSLATIGIDNPLETLRSVVAATLDGYGWKPLSTEHDYNAVYRRVAEEIFRDPV